MTKRTGKWIALCVLALAGALLLSGCYVPPVDITGSTQELLPGGFQNYTAQPTNAPQQNSITPQGTTVILGGNTTGTTGSTGSTGTTGTTGSTGTTGTTVVLVTTQPSSGVATIPSLTNIPILTAQPVTTTATVSLRLGATGSEVRALQQRLKDLKYYTGSVDGDFGEGTEAAVKAFQKAHGLSVDGVAGTRTLTTLNSSAAKTNTATATPRVTATPRPTATPKTDNVYLKLDSSGSDVRKMQERLIELGYLDGKANGKFDAATEQAVIAFQKRNCSYYDGIAGPETLKALYSSSAKSTSTAAGVIGDSLREGSTGDAVRTLQRQLKALGYYSGSVDGDYGSGTVSAVKAFQKANGLTVDGVAGAGTLSKLYSDDAVTAAGAAAGGSSSDYTTPTPKPEYVTVTSPPGGGYVVLKQGNKGQLVKDLQRALKNKGYYSGSVDGDYGESTVKAVKAFQRDKGLKQTGTATVATQTALFQGDFPDGA